MKDHDTPDVIITIDEYKNIVGVGGLKVPPEARKELGWDKPASDTHKLPEA